MMRTRVLAGAVMTAALIVAIGCGSGAKPDSSSATVAPAQGTGQASAAKKRKRSANWPTYHANLARTAVDSSSPPFGGLRHIWTQRFDGQVYAEPLAVGNRVYVAT